MQLDAVRAFVKVAELGSFTRAGEHLGLSKARVSTLLSELEADLGTRLLQRTTRALKLTGNGEEFLPKARRLLADVDELAAQFRSPGSLRGSVRIDMPVGFARSLYIPRIPELLSAYPGIELSLSTTDRRVDVVREGFDGVLRVGQMESSGLVFRKLGSLPMVNCISPTYAARYGIPTTIAELAGHYLVHYSIGLGQGGAAGSEPPCFEYVEGGTIHEVPMRSLLTVNSTDAYRVACEAGLGIIQAPRFGVLGALADGALLEVLAEHVCSPMPVSLVHGYARSVPRHVKVVHTWIATIVMPHLQN